MKLSEKMWLIILKVTKKQGFTLPLEDTFLEKNTGEGELTLLQAFLGLIY